MSAALRLHATVVVAVAWRKLRPVAAVAPAHGAARHASASAIMLGFFQQAARHARHCACSRVEASRLPALASRGAAVPPKQLLVHCACRCWSTNDLRSLMYEPKVTVQVSSCEVAVRHNVLHARGWVSHSGAQRLLQDSCSVLLRARHNRPSDGRYASYTAGYSSPGRMLRAAGSRDLLDIRLARAPLRRCSQHTSLTHADLSGACYCKRLSPASRVIAIARLRALLGGSVFAASRALLSSETAWVRCIQQALARRALATEVTSACMPSTTFDVIDRMHTSGSLRAAPLHVWCPLSGCGCSFAVSR
jgi:hypothetical protein